MFSVATISHADGDDVMELAFWTKDVLALPSVNCQVDRVMLKDESIDAVDRKLLVLIILSVNALLLLE